MLRDLPRRMRRAFTLQARILQGFARQGFLTPGLRSKVSLVLKTSFCVALTSAALRASGVIGLVDVVTAAAARVASALPAPAFFAIILALRTRTLERRDTPGDPVGPRRSTLPSPAWLAGDSEV
mmetsp:Transcript_10362/g.27578  ORF Transcript_10362/g.27578 Transcript_10362/m.27578 type:complete len:124 (-) Transcript_10362:1047-1418(-)